MWVAWLERQDAADGCTQRIDLSVEGNAVELGRKDFFDVSVSKELEPLKVSRAHCTVQFKKGVVPLLLVEGKAFVRGKSCVEQKCVLQPGDTLSLLAGEKHTFAFRVQKKEQPTQKEEEKKVDSKSTSFARQSSVGTNGGESMLKKPRVDSSVGGLSNVRTISSIASSSASSSAPNHTSNHLVPIPRNGLESRARDRPNPLSWYVNAMPGRNNDGCLDIRSLFQDDGMLCIDLFSYNLDDQWIRQAIPCLNYVPVWVSSAEEPTFLPSNWKYTRPEVPKWGTPHGKMFIIYFAERVRVVISTANAIPLDYLYRANGIWTQDFPYGPEAAPTDFRLTLQDYMTRIGCPHKLDAYNFSEAKVALVTSVPGKHGGKELNRYGHARVAALVRPDKGAPLDGPLIINCSSLGKMSKPYVDQLAKSVGCTEVQLIWPSVECVRTNCVGYLVGGSICLNQHNVTDVTRGIMRWRYEGSPARHDVTPHIKTMFSMKRGEGNICNWFYVGSHNLSKSAWGEMQQTGRFNVLSFEIGVLFHEKLLGHPVRLGTFPRPGEMTLPYVFPFAKAYNHKANDLENTPWTWDIDHRVPDNFGSTFASVRSAGE